VSATRFIAALAAASLLLGTCGAPEQKVVRRKPWFSGLKDAQGDTAAIIPDEEQRTYFELPESEIVVEKPDGSRELLARNGRHLMVHVYNCLMDMERELFVDQVLSDETKAEFRERGFDPADAFERLLAMEDDIVLLFSLMPNGERSPGVLYRPVGGRVFRVELTGPQASGLALAGFDMVMERGNWKLRWFVPGRNAPRRPGASAAR